MTGAELYTLLTSLNGGASIDQVLATTLIDNAKSMIEGERPWAVLRKIDTSKTVTTAGTWETAIDLSTISDFSELYSESPIQLFDGDNQIQDYTLRSFEDRLRLKDASNTAVFDENSQSLYLNGNIPYNGTLYINYKATTPEIDLTSTSAVWTQFPSRYVPILAYFAVGINKGAIDYDEINRRMLPENRAVLIGLMNSMSKWDNNKQMVAVRHNDPTDFYGSGHRNGAINMDEY